MVYEVVRRSSFILVTVTAIRVARGKSVKQDSVENGLSGRAILSKFMDQLARTNLIGMLVFIKIKKHSPPVPDQLFSYKLSFPPSGLLLTSHHQDHQRSGAEPSVFPFLWLVSFLRERAGTGPDVEHVMKIYRIFLPRTHSFQSVAT